MLDRLHRMMREMQAQDLRAPKRIVFVFGDEASRRAALAHATADMGRTSNAVGLVAHGGVDVEFVVDDIK